MDLRRTTTIRLAALTTLLSLSLATLAPSVLASSALASSALASSALASSALASSALASSALAEPAPDDVGNAATSAPARQVREFFWMNALRSDHDRRARATADSRMRTNVSHLRRAHVDLGVLAETAPDQRRDFRRLGGDTWELVDGGNTIDNVVLYRRSAFTMIGRDSLTVRYVHGHRVHLPIPELRDNATGAVVAVIPVHNARQKAGPWRRMSLAREVAKVKQLRRAHPTWQVVIAGDFNAEWTPSCAFTHIGMTSLLSTRQHCHKVLPIDQMFATPGLGAHGYRRVHTTATDHHREYHAKLVLTSSWRG